MTSPTSALGTPPSALQEDVVLSVRGVSKCFEMYEKPVYRLYQTLCVGKSTLLQTAGTQG